MNPFQQLSFDSIEECLDFLPEHERKLTEHLRQIVLSSILEVKEKLSYNVPFFARNRNICFIWPASIPWGKVKKEGVMFGFTQGHLLTGEFGYLEVGRRKFVRSKTFFSLKEIEDELLCTFIFEAVEWDNQHKLL